MGGVEPIDDVIARDLGRTFPEHPLFRDREGQGRLGRLLRAYALHDEEVGYCQGQGERWLERWSVTWLVHEVRNL
jgi:hypothetical protein